MLDIIFENEDILVINKPYGIAVHGDGKSTEKNIVDIVLEKYREIENVGEDIILVDKVIKKSGLVHRLDKDTSGVLLIAKNDKAYQFYKNLFMERKIRKEYHAFLYGIPKEKKGTIDANISRAKGDIRKWTALPSQKRDKERNAITDYEVVKYFDQKDRDFADKGSTEIGTFSYVKFFPKTGRTHQLRVHAKFMNHPIVCDPIYSKNEKALGFLRLALHARSLSFVDMDGKERVFIANFLADFIDGQKAIGLDFI